MDAESVWRVAVNLVWVIPVKAESGRLPNKNMLSLGPDGWPMYWYTVAEALEAGGTVVIATDSSTIGYDAVGRSGLRGLAVMDDRPPQLSEPGCSAVEVVKWVMAKMEVPDTDEWGVGMLLPTSPLRTAATIKRAVELWRVDQAASVATVREIPRAGVRWEHANGWLDAWEPPGKVRPSGWPQPPKVYVSTGGVQLTSAKTLYSLDRYWVPKTRPIVLDAIEGLDIDTEAEFKLADAILRSRA